MKELKEALNNLADILSPYDEATANYIRKIKINSPQDLANDLSLWGGAGSLMDQGIPEQPREIQRVFEESAINLGKVLLKAGCKNQRMENWVSTFEKWANESV